MRNDATADSIDVDVLTAGIDATEKATGLACSLIMAMRGLMLALLWPAGCLR